MKPLAKRAAAAPRKRDAGRATRYPLREKRKRESRARFIASAAELFERNGVESTTLEDVAAHAGLHPQTLYRHFKTRRDLYRETARHYADRFATAFRARDPREDTLSFWRRWIGEESSRTSRRGEAAARRALQRRFTEGSFRSPVGALYEDVLIEGLAADLGVDPAQGSLPRLGACLLLGAAASARREWAFATDGRSLADCYLKLIDEAIATFGDRLRKRKR